MLVLYAELHGLVSTKAAQVSSDVSLKTKYNPDSKNPKMKKKNNKNAGVEGEKCNTRQKK